MATQAIPSIPSVTPNPVASTKSADTGNGTDNQFQQTLSQQITDRQNAGNADSTQNASNASDSGKANNVAKIGSTDKSADTGKTAASNKTKDDKKADAVLKTGTDVNGLDAANTANATNAANLANAAATNLPPTATELLASVANAQNQAGRQTLQTGTPAATVADAKVGTGIGSMPVADGGKTALTTRIDSTKTIGDAASENAAKDVSGHNGTNFRTTLEQANDAKNLQDPAAVKSQDNAAVLAASDKLQAAASALPVAAKTQDTIDTTSNVAVPQIQQTALNVAHTVAGIPTEKLTPSVGTQAWDQALGQKVVWMVAGSQQSASLTLNPPDLGPMQVVLHVSNGQTDASFFAAQPEVRHAIEAALPHLREMMSEAGIQLGQANVSSGMPNQQGGSNAQSQPTSNGIGNAGSTDDQTANVVRISRTQNLSDGLGLVDTFA